MTRWYITYLLVALTMAVAPLPVETMLGSGLVMTKYLTDYKIHILEKLEMIREISMEQAKEEMSYKMTMAQLGFEVEEKLNGSFVLYGIVSGHRYGIHNTLKEAYRTAAECTRAEDERAFAVKNPVA